MTKALSVQPGVFLDVWYDRHGRTWWGRYVDVDGNQMGSAWFDASRDYVLIFRPSAPSTV